MKTCAICGSNRAPYLTVDPAGPEYLCGDCFDSEFDATHPEPEPCCHCGEAPGEVETRGGELSCRDCLIEQADRLIDADRERRIPA